MSNFPKVIVFDLDDTLILERDYAFSGFRALEPFIQTSLGIYNFSSHCENLWLRGQRDQIFNRVLLDLGQQFDEQFIHLLVDKYRNHIPTISLMQDAELCLEELRSLAEQPKLALISDGYLVTQKQKTRVLELEGKLDYCILTDQWGKEFWKPHRRAFVEVQQYFGVLPNECVYIGDNPSKDFHAPFELGWKMVRIAREHSLYKNQPCQIESVLTASISCLENLAELFDA